MKFKLSSVIALAVLFGSNLSYAQSAVSLAPPPGPRPPAPVDTGSARNAGMQDGTADGRREGDVRGPNEGHEDGQRNGRANGYQRCERNERQEAQNNGYRAGYPVGERDGIDRGTTDGITNGENQGNINGIRDGALKAEQDAELDATPLGRAQGIEEANQSDASTLGTQAGTISGDKDALAKAVAVDYPRGRADYRNEIESEPIENEDSYLQSALQAVSSVQNFIKSLSENESERRATPDRRFYHIRRNYPTSEENSAYRNGYDSGYSSGFHSGYNSSYQSAYRQAYDHGDNQGCQDARRQDYSRDYDRGYQEGYREGNSRAYQTAYDSAYRTSYQRIYPVAYENSHRETYPRAYAVYFEKARQQAYQEKYGEIYQSYFNVAYDKKFQEVYPLYAVEQYNLGRKDEAVLFEQLPVRLTGSEMIETIPNGLYEPGEPLKLKIKIRNFIGRELNGKDIQVKIRARNAAAAVISRPEVLLSQNLRRKSMTTISNVLEIRFNESVVNQSSTFDLILFYQGRDCGTFTFKLTPKFLLDLQFATPPVLREGMRSTFEAKVTNQANVRSDASTIVRLLSNSPAIEIVEGQADLSSLNPGESAIVKFVVIGRQGGNPEIPLAFEALTTSGRRIGLLDKTFEVPVLNDYTITLKQVPQSLREVGITRVDYVIDNVSSRLIMRSLQLITRFTPNEGEPFVVVGPNPQYLRPLLKGQATSFVVPVFAKEKNNGGILELEVQENGQTVVIHRVQF